jgi:uncharacterized protein YodC (DUF2158 family)
MVLNRTRQEIACGDTVRLKSGGPLMTVQDITPGSDSIARCMWWADGCYQYDSFVTQSLKKEISND